jgi:predicted MPP superfamily phosphohydrolase
MSKWRLSRRDFVIGGIAGGGAIAIGGIGTIEANALRVEEVEVPFAGQDGRGLRFAFLTDWHLDDHQAVERGRKSIELASKAKPHAILLGGDYCSTSVTHWRDRVVDNALQQLFDVGVPVFGVLGNHDYGSRIAPLLPAMFQKYGLRMLINENVKFQGIKIAGTDDLLFGSPDLGSSFGKGDPNMLALMHEPDFVPPVLGSVGAVLSGHTHGGQVCYAPGKPVHLPRGGRRFVSGLYRIFDRSLYVSRGVGMTGLDLRMFAPPEVTILTLT